MIFGSSARVRRLIVLSCVVLLGLVFLASMISLRLSGSAETPGLSVTAATHDSFEVTSPLILSRDPWIVLDRGRVSVARTGSAAPLGAAAIYAALAKRDAALTLENGEIGLTEHEPAPAPFVGTMDTGRETAPLVAALGALKFKSLAVRNTEIVVEGNGGGVARFTITAAEIDRVRGEGFAARGEAKLRGEPFTFETDLGAPTSKNTELGLPLKLTAKSRVLDVHFNGHARIAGRLQLAADVAEVASTDVGALMQLAGIAWPNSSGIRSFHAKGPFAWSGGVAGFDNAACEIDGNAAVGNLAIDTGGARPAIEATLAFEELVLDPYLTSGDSTGIPSQIARALALVPLTGLVRSSDGILLEAANADVRISAAHVLKSGTDFGQVAASLTLRDGALIADFTEIMLPSGGTGNAQVTTALSDGEPRYTLRLNLDNVAIESLTEQAFGAPIAEGAGSLKIELASDVIVTNDILPHLKGKITLAAPGRVRLAGNLEALLTAVARKPAEGWDMGQGRMMLDDLVSRLTLSSGVLTAEQVTARSGSVHLKATGSVSLANRTLDLTLSRSPDANLAGAGPSRAEAIELRGAWNHPSLRSASPPPAALRSDAVLPSP